MKFLIPFLGKTKEPYLDAGIRDYAGRLGRFAVVDLPVLKERHSHKDPDEVVKQNDAGLLLEQAGVAGLRVALDPTGKTPDSAELAALLTHWQDQSIGTICFLIGGHLGLHRSVLDRADLILSLSRLTFTHEMTRLILLEQLYRACTIKAGHKYHK
ncbi:MAG: 23S rRNA (pseudouridine(1915)-N(3))-methyltransferase RlmH [Desulfobulbaceae bacterium]|jgi:23S rRNA (pseudouridine1915-N3)-methyltransferase|nr:23S rRNA (pseudouridine(1915)-N(3))-methyltransferase RlmH [Desulfobulbaceae bacterium]